MLVSKELMEAFSWVPRRKTNPEGRYIPKVFAGPGGTLIGFSKSRVYLCQCGHNHPGAGKCVRLAFPDKNASHCSCGCVVPRKTSPVEAFFLEP